MFSPLDEITNERKTRRFGSWRQWYANVPIGTGLFFLEHS